MADGHITRDSATRLAGHDGSGRPSQCPGDPDGQRVRGAHDLYAQAEAARKQSQALAGQLRATQHKASENWQLIRAAWSRAEEIRVIWVAGHSDPGRLRYWAWWVTPEEEPRRFDTRFFVAGVPAGAAVTAHLAEAERERWLPPAVAAADQGMPMLPPTRYALRDLAPFTGVEEALAAAGTRRVERILPVLEGDELVMPWRERYPVPVPLPDPAGPPA